MHWVYVIACEDDSGRFREHSCHRAHFKGQGSVCTRTHKPLHVAGLYRIGRHASYRDGCDIHMQKPADKPNALWLEQRFVEEMRRVCSAKVVGGFDAKTIQNTRVVGGRIRCVLRLQLTLRNRERGGCVRACVRRKKRDVAETYASCTRSKHPL